MARTAPDVRAASPIEPMSATSSEMPPSEGTTQTTLS
jgi:hypothetical protein